MTLYAYRIHRCFLNGWIDAEEMLEDVAEIDQGEAYLKGWREEMANRLAMAANLFEAMGWNTAKAATVWLAPLPVAFARGYYGLVGLNGFKGLDGPPSQALSI